MTRRLGLGVFSITLTLCGTAAAAPPVGSTVSFLACPIARDTGPDTDLCFLAEHQGERFGLSNPPDFGNPQLKHRVLVEGRVIAGPPVCGATPLEGRVSVMPEIDTACDQLLPFDGTVTGVAGGVFNSGPPAQRARMRALAEQAAREPALSVQPVMPDPPPAPPPAPPFDVRRFSIHYPFDSDRASGPDMLEVTRLLDYARAANARVTLVSRQGASQLSNGQTVAESPGTARRRAQKLAGILTGLGLASSSLSVSWIDAAARPDGIEDWRERRIDLTVTPGP